MQFTKRSINLSSTFIKFAIAWGWRDFIVALIEAVYGVDGTEEAVSAYWGFYVVIAIFVAIAFSFSDSFHILCMWRHSGPCSVCLLLCLFRDLVAIHSLTV